MYVRLRICKVHLPGKLINDRGDYLISVLCASSVTGVNVVLLLITPTNTALSASFAHIPPEVIELYR